MRSGITERGNAAEEVEVKAETGKAQL